MRGEIKGRQTVALQLVPALENLLGTAIAQPQQEVASIHEIHPPGIASKQLKQLFGTPHPHQLLQQQPDAEGHRGLSAQGEITNQLSAAAGLRPLA